MVHRRLSLPLSQTHSLDITCTFDSSSVHRDVRMASQSVVSKGDVITMVADDFDKVGYTKADEADMAKQYKKQQFHVRCALVASVMFLLV